jgi:CBS-domain-containing membrane protein
MQAREIMTKDVVTVSPDTSTPQVAQRLLEHKISAVPVIDSSGMVIGMVSEGDLVGRNDADREERRDWWLSLIAEGEALHPDFLASLRRPELTARDVMSAPVIRITETTDDIEIARLLATHRIKRVPVVRDGHLIGIVSRADLLRGFAAERAEQQGPEHISRARNLLADAISAIDEHFLRHRERTQAAATPALHRGTEDTLSATDFQELIGDFERQKVQRQDETRRATAERRQQRVKGLIDQHITDGNWSAMVHRAREAAEHGEKEIMLLSFPSDLCTDQGRAINAPLPDWPKTLRGEAAEIYLRWERELKPRGFHLTARVLDFPGGKPGDIGLFLLWGQ